MKKKIIGIVLTFFVVVSTLLTIFAFRITPVTLKRDTFVYEYGTPISNNPVDYVNANANVINEVQLNFSNLKNEIGVYKVSASYAGVEFPFYIKIQDTTKPVVTLNQVVFNVNLNEEISALNLIDKVEDQSEVIAYFLEDDGTKNTTLKFTKKGSYIVNIIVEDVAGNQAAKLRAKIVVGVILQSQDVHTLEGIDDVEIVQGTHFDIMEGVKASDGNGNDITHQIKILKNTVNTEEVGSYEVIYSITNSQGNNIQRTRKVEVIKNESEKKK